MAKKVVVADTAAEDARAASATTAPAPTLLRSTSAPRASCDSCAEDTSVKNTSDVGAGRPDVEVDGPPVENDGPAVASDGPEFEVAYSDGDGGYRSSAGNAGPGASSSEVEVDPGAPSTMNTEACTGSASPFEVEAGPTTSSSSPNSTSMLFRRNIPTVVLLSLVLPLHSELLPLFMRVCKRQYDDMFAAPL